MTDNSPIRIYVIKRIPVRTKRGYYLELLTFETMELLGSTKNKLTKDENGENMLIILLTMIINKI